MVSRDAGAWCRGVGPGAGLVGVPAESACPSAVSPQLCGDAGD